MVDTTNASNQSETVPDNATTNLAPTPAETDANTVELLITLTKDPTGTVLIKKITDKGENKTYFNIADPSVNTINTAWPPQPTQGGSKHRSRRNRRNKSRQRSSTNSRPNLSFNQIQRRTRRQLFRQLF
jgi:hypothetical protein